MKSSLPNDRQCSPVRRANAFLSPEKGRAGRSTLPALMASALLMVTALDSVGFSEQAQSSDRPISAADFQLAAPRGFGDRQNSWAQSMVWWRNHLYVGTSRASLCTSLFAIWRFVAFNLGRELADTYLPYPPPSSDLSCATDGADLPLQAEIWRWTPGRDEWTRVFQSPLDIDNPGPPPQPGKKLPYEMAIRGMTAHTEPDGTEALYAFGINTAVMWDSTKIPPPRILRTTDGVNFTPVPQTPGTFLGDLPFNPDHSSFRSPLSFNGKLFVLSGPIFGQGSLIASADPAKGDDAWFLAAPANVMFYEIAAFNGWLYLGTFSPLTGGYSILKTRAEGPPPYQFVTVIPVGAYHPDPRRASRSVVSMNEYQGRLYVGTASFTEMVRINPDDTWDVVFGPARMAPAPGGGVEWKYPLSGLDNGFGHTLNDHAWQMADVYGNLYVGTYNASTGARFDPVNGPKLFHNMGAHLYRTTDGWYYSAITTNGFADLGDPQGGRHDYGLRTMVSTPHGAFFATANDSWGLAIFQANTADTPGGSLPAPVRLEVEPIRSGAALLSWQAMPGRPQYQVWRAERFLIQIRTETNIEAWTSLTGNLVDDIYVGPYEQIGVTDRPFYVDQTVQAGSKYMYHVLQVQAGRVSDQSNLVSFPLLTPPMTFAQLQHEIDTIEFRERFRSGGATNVRGMVLDAGGLAAGCHISDALKALNPQTASTSALFPESVDIEIMMSKLVRRLTLYEQLPADVMSTEFCTQ
jgi:hypothetical protein